MLVFRATFLDKKPQITVLCLQHGRTSICKSVPFPLLWYYSSSDPTGKSEGVTWLQWRRPDGTLEVSPTHRQSLLRTDTTRLWLDTGNKRWMRPDLSCQRSCLRNGEQGERLPLLPCRRMHTVTRGTAVKEAQRVTQRSTQDLGDAEAVGSS